MLKMLTRPIFQGHSMSELLQPPCTQATAALDLTPVPVTSLTWPNNAERITMKRLATIDFCNSPCSLNGLRGWSVKSRKSMLSKGN